MDTFEFLALLYYSALFLLGGGLFFWGYRVGLKNAKEDMEEILGDIKKKNER